MKQEYYSPEVKAYDPMRRQPMEGIDAIINSEHPLYQAYSRKCLDYNPIGPKSDFYQPEYRVQLFNETTRQPEKLFKQKEERIRKYQPGEIKNNDKWNFTISERIFRGGNLFSRFFQNIIKTVQRWYQILNRSSK